MDKTFDISKFFKLFVLAAFLIVLLGTVLLIFLGGETHLIYANGNLDFSFYVKAVLTTVFICILVSLYYAVRFRKKNGFKAGLISGAVACVCALTSFFICVIFRAPLCSYVFPVILLSVCESFVCSVVFFDFLNNTTKKSKKGNDKNSSATALAFAKLRSFIFLILAILLVAFVAALILGADLLTCYAFPCMMAVLFSALFSLSSYGKFFGN